MLLKTRGAERGSAGFTIPNNWRGKAKEKTRVCNQERGFRVEKEFSD